MVHDIPQLNSIITRSKTHWNYPIPYLTLALPLILLNPSWIENNEGYTLIYEGIPIGFLGFKPGKNSIYLEHLWIDPPYIGQGHGRRAIEFLMAIGRERNIPTINLYPDPPAEGFYQRLGAVYTGTKVPSRIEGGPLFQEMLFTL